MVISATDEHTFPASSFLCTPPSEPLRVFCDTLNALIFMQRRAAKKRGNELLGKPLWTHPEWKQGALRAPQRN